MNNDNAVKDEPKHCHSYNLRPSKKRNLKSEKMKKFHVESNKNDKDLDISKLVNNESNFNQNDPQKVDNEINVDMYFNSQIVNDGRNNNIDHAQMVNNEINVDPNIQVENQRNEEIVADQNPQPNKIGLSTALIYTGDFSLAEDIDKSEFENLQAFTCPLHPQHVTLGEFKNGTHAFTCPHCEQ